jgi:hypothetical protein
MAMKLEQSADRDARGRRPARVPVTWRLQLFPAQLRCSMTEPRARPARGRIIAAFILRTGRLALEGLVSWKSWGLRGRESAVVRNFPLRKTPRIVPVYIGVGWKPS